MGFWDTVRDGLKNAAKEIGAGLKNAAKEIGAKMWDDVKERGKRSIRESLFPSQIPSDVQLILDSTPADETPVIPLRPDTEPFLATSMWHIPWVDWFGGETSGSVAGRQVRLLLPDELRALYLGDNYACAKEAERERAETTESQQDLPHPKVHRFTGGKCTVCGAPDSGPQAWASICKGAV